MPVPAIIAASWPVWADCPWPLPAGFSVYRLGDRAAFVREGLAVGIVVSTFDVKSLTSILELFPGYMPASPGPGGSSAA